MNLMGWKASTETKQTKKGGKKQHGALAYI